MIDSINIKKTLNLPKTSFPMKANLVLKEPKRINHWKKINLYNKILEFNKNNTPFILHDGPPFTNGDVHIGTAMNKIIKSVILFYKIMNGAYPHFYPGWDCHGLPIEYKVIKKFYENTNTMNNISLLRSKCLQFSENFIKKQKTQFERLGIVGCWDNEYKTTHPKYEANVIKLFAQLVKKNLIYRQKKPVYWSIPCQTTLAEAEIEYKTHQSQSIYVKFNIKINNLNLNIQNNTSFVIWTTTPWTLPANVAIAINKNIKYQEIYNLDNNEIYLISEKTCKNFLKDCNLKNVQLGRKISGQLLNNINVYHPLIEKLVPVIYSDHVDENNGTGCVHIAPAHGIEDYHLAKLYKLPIISILDDNCAYIQSSIYPIPSSLIGVKILSDNMQNSPANTMVINLLKNNNKILMEKLYTHSYPYCWRSKTPLIFRALDQWFLELNEYKLKALNSVKKIKWIPEWGENRINAHLKNRPNWCISRQRCWGVPLIIFYDEFNSPILDYDLINKIAIKIEKYGSNIWFEKPSSYFVAGTKYAGLNLKKSNETLDVWLESGTSHLYVLGKNIKADLCCEGSDQHRGWFQSSLLTSIIINDEPPFKQIITHGFVIDKKSKQKVSKSENVDKNSEYYVNNFGADIIRLWVCSENYKNDISISDDILKQVQQIYRNFRNTIRFQLGNLNDFVLNKHEVEVKKMTAIDQWILHKTNILIEQCTKFYNDYSFHKVINVLNNFCSVTLSSIYHDILKDRLYTYDPISHERRSSQTALYYIASVFIRLIAPILCFTADEAFSFFEKNTEFLNTDSVFFKKIPTKNIQWENTTLYNNIELLLELKQKINEKIEHYRETIKIGQSLDVKVNLYININHKYYSILYLYKQSLSELFVVSEVNIILDPKINNICNIVIDRANGVKCPRSWRWVPFLVKSKKFGYVSPRCKTILDKYFN